MKIQNSLKSLQPMDFMLFISHIWEGKDFFNYEASELYDYIISNPPFTKKLHVLRDYTI